MRGKVSIFVLLFIVLLLSLFYVMLSANTNNLKSDIKTGELLYSCNCGWINWGHALPDGVKNLVTEVVYDTSSNTKRREISYAQQMKINFIFKSKIVVEVSRKYSLAGVLTRKEKEEIAFAIFQQTSESFEKMQGTFPFDLNYGSQNSSFKDGDLTGNTIAFYRALRGYTKEFMREICKPVSINKSLALFNDGKLKLNKKWAPNYWTTKGIYPKELKEINPDTNLITKKLIFKNETKSIYLDF